MSAVTIRDFLEGLELGGGPGAPASINEALVQAWAGALALAASLAGVSVLVVVYP